MVDVCCRTMLVYARNEFGIAIMECKTCGEEFTIYPTRADV